MYVLSNCRSRHYASYIEILAKNISEQSMTFYESIKGATIAQGTKAGGLLFDEYITVILSNADWPDGQVGRDVAQFKKLRRGICREIAT